MLNASNIEYLEKAHEENVCFCPRDSVSYQAIFDWGPFGCQMAGKAS